MASKEDNQVAVGALLRNATPSMDHINEALSQRQMDEAALHKFVEEEVLQDDFIYKKEGPENAPYIKFFDESLDSHWRDTVIDSYLSSDRKHWDELSDEPMRKRILLILSFFAGADGIVTRNLMQRFSHECEKSIIEAFYAFQAFQEVIHGFTYTKLINTYTDGPEHRQEIFESLRTNPVIRKKALFALNNLEHESLSVGERLVAFACVEGILFSSSFATIYWLKRRYPGKFTALVDSNDYIARDEKRHADFACVRYVNEVQDKLSQKRVHEIIFEAVQCELEFVAQLFPPGETEIEMNFEIMSSYVMQIANQLLNHLGYEILFHNDKAMIPMFMLELGTRCKVNMHEKPGNEYKTTVKKSMFLRKDLLK